MMPRPVSKTPLDVVISIMGTWDEHSTPYERCGRVAELTVDYILMDAQNNIVKKKSKMVCRPSFFIVRNGNMF